FAGDFDTKCFKNYGFASFGNRLVAMFIDFFILSSVLSFLWWFLQIDIQDDLIVKKFDYWVLFKDPRAYLISMLYFSFLESSSWQATIGKKVMSIKVVNPLGQRIFFAVAFARWIDKLFSVLLLCLGFLLMLFTKNRQCLHDIMAQTYVVNKDKITTD
ncbi:MAG: RDD family protein, partial [Flavobacteriales bacterium]|nr:RDD family protein [Flavobacteriales bacterium]